jgi:protein-tyrosine phosphatase
MAEGLLQRALQLAGISTVTVESAGTFPVEGMSPTRETQRVLQEVGIDCSAHLARTLTMEMVQMSDLILVMEQGHAEEILRRYPSAKGKVSLLKPYGLSQPELEANPNIPDPIGKPLEVYEVCFASIREAVERVAKSRGIYSA